MMYIVLITHNSISIDMVYLLFRLYTSILLNVSQAFSSRTSRASDAREEDCASTYATLWDKAVMVLQYENTLHSDK